MRSTLVNIVCFQAGWFACVLGAASGNPALGPIVVGLWLAAHLAFSASWRAEVGTILAAGLLGYAADSLLVFGGVLSFPPHAQLGGPSPLWMVALWMNLAGTLSASMRWLRGRFLWAALLGAIGGPLSYVSGARLGAAQFAGHPLAGPVTVAVVWAVSMPFLLVLADLFDRRTSLAAGPIGGA